MIGGGHFHTQAGRYEDSEKTGVNPGIGVWGKERRVGIITTQLPLPWWLMLAATGSLLDFSP